MFPLCRCSVPPSVNFPCSLSFLFLISTLVFCHLFIELRPSVILFNAYRAVLYFHRNFLFFSLYLFRTHASLHHFITGFLPSGQCALSHCYHNWFRLQLPWRFNLFQFRLASSSNCIQDLRSDFHWWLVFIGTHWNKCNPTSAFDAISSYRMKTTVKHMSEARQKYGNDRRARRARSKCIHSNYSSKLFWSFCLLSFPFLQR